MLPAAWPTVAPLIRPYGPFSGGAAARLPQFTVPEIVARLSWLNSASGNVTFRSIVTKAFVRPDGGGGDGTGAVMTVLPGRIGALTTATGGGGTKSALPATPPPVVPVARETSATTTVPRTPATAFCVRISIDSPGFILSLAMASAILPASRSIVDLPGTSVIVSDERSRTVTTALPPSSIRAIALSPVVTLSFTNTSSLNLSGCGCGSATRVTVTLPSSVVTTPARGACPKTRGGQNVATARMAAAGRRNRDMRSPELCELTGDRVAARRASGAENLVEPVQGPEPRAIYVGDDHCRIGTRRQPKLSESQRGGANPAPRGSTSGLTGTWVR